MGQKGFVLLIDWGRMDELELALCLNLPSPNSSSLSQANFFENFLPVSLGRVLWTIHLCKFTTFFIFFWVFGFFFSLSSFDERKCWCLFWIWSLYMYDNYKREVLWGFSNMFVWLIVYVWTMNYVSGSSGLIMHFWVFLLFFFSWDGW